MTFERMARFAVARRRPVIAAWLLATAIAVPLALSLPGRLSGAGWDAQGSEAARVRAELRQDFPDVPAEAAVVVVSSPGAPAVKQRLLDVPEAERVLDGPVSRDGRTALVLVDLRAGDEADRPEAAAAVRDAVERLDLPPGVDADVTGEWPMWADFNESNEQALHRAELLSGVPSLLLLLVAFGTAVAAGVPLLLALFGIAIAFAVLALATGATPLSVWSMNFSMMMGLAVGIDYSLFVVSRWREERARGLDTTEAVVAAMATAGKAVFLSAITVIVSLAAVFLVPVMVFRSMALGMILSVTAVAAASLTLLPALLGAGGDRFLRRSDKPVSADRWARWADRATARPRTWLAAGVALLLLLAVPVVGLRLGMPGPRVVDEGRSSRDGYERLVAAFGAGASAPLYVTVPADEADDVVDVARGTASVADAAVVSPPSDRGRVVVRVLPVAGIEDRRTTGLVSRLREEVRAVSPAASVGGPTAQNRDLADALQGRTPLAVGVILVVAFVLLLVVFRSVPVAVASVVVNLLTVAAAFGFATLVFQHGYGAGLVGIEHQGFVDAWAPLFFFALLFGLSMDYQLFLLAAVRERVEAGNDTPTAVRAAVAATGRPITNAAAVMLVVFVAFGVTGPIPPTELGITLALAVLLDATLVRMLVIPTTLVLLGERTWRLPALLDRILPHVTFRH